MVLGAWLCLSTPLKAAEITAPTQERWQPIEQALNAGDDNTASGLLSNIVSEFPDWPQGWLKRAEVNERLKNLSAALKDAEKAYNLEAKDEEVASTYARLLVRQNKFQETLAVLKAFPPQQDRKGWIHYYGAKAAFRLDQLDQASDIINRGMKSLGPNIPPEFRFISGWILKEKGDLSGAAAAFRPWLA